MTFPQVSWATDPGSESAPNEDFVLTVPGFAVVLDGVTRAPGTRTGCVHGTPWYVARLAAALAGTLLGDSDARLADALAHAIDAVAGEHAGTCDLTHRATPATTVAVLRARTDAVDYLVLADSVILLDLGDDVRVVTDPENVAVAASDPEAAYEAMTGTVPRPGLQRAAAVTDGASRLVDDFGLADWHDLLDILEADGPGGLIRQVRGAEHRDPEGAWWPRTKRHDDATAVFWRFTPAARGEP